MSLVKTFPDLSVSKFGNFHLVLDPTLYHNTYQIKTKTKHSLRCLLKATHWSKHLTCINLFNIHISPKRQMDIIVLLSRRGNRLWETLNVTNRKWQSWDINTPSTTVLYCHITIPLSNSAVIHGTTITCHIWLPLQPMSTLQPRLLECKGVRGETQKITQSLTMTYIFIYL